VPSPHAAKETALAASFLRLSPHEAVAALAARTTTKRFAAGDFLLRGGERAELVFFVVRGLVRELYVGDDGREHTRSFVAEGQPTGSLLDLLSGAPSVTWIQALEETATLAFRYAEFEALCERYPALHLEARRHVEALYVKKARREHEMLALSAAARFQRWREVAPGLDARVSRRHLASYLGVTPEHLSRLTRAAREAAR
jgi:CRP-like cAMP-binding protein